MGAVKCVRTTGWGFTLVELLVVIAIIGVLIGMLVGGLGGALREAEKLECQNNLRQIAAAVINYTTDYKGAIPPTKYSTTSLYWCNFLVRGGYLGAEDVSKLDSKTPSTRNSVLRCPAENGLMLTSDSESIALPATTTGDDKAQAIARLGNASFRVDCSYYWNGYAGNSNGEPEVGSNSWTARFPSCVVNPGASPDKKALVLHDISEIRQRTATVMVMDGVLFDANAKSNRGRIAARHAGEEGDHTTTNVAFYDGHVASVSRTPGDDKQFTSDPIQLPQDLEMTGTLLFLLPKR
ncbi:MAG: type II secretion system protein [Planctomycetota bacterium]|nr:type II secretion system protein [Planctomycetota bacterium]